MKDAPPSLHQKVAMITGAGSGIGEAISLSLAGAGGRVVLCGRDSKKLETVKKKILEFKQTAEILTFSFDVQDAKKIDEVVASTLKHFGAIDILINNAGIAAPLLPLHEASIADIDRVLDTNLKAAAYLMRAVLPEMIAKKSGTIININSIAGKNAFPNWSIYNASKFGLTGLTRAVSEEQRRNNIKVISIHPGAVSTPIWNTVDVGSEPLFEEMLTAKNVSNAVLYALSQPDNALISELTIEPLKDVI